MARIWSAIGAGLLIVGLALGVARPEALALEPPGCQVEHRTPAAIIEIAGTGAEYTPIPDPIPYATPDGIAVTPATTDQIFALLETMTACVNEGDILGFLSLLSNDFIARHFGDFDLTLDTLTAAVDNPMPLPEDEHLTVVEVRNATELPDGRFTALVIFDQGEIESPELDSVLTFVERDGRLLIDEWQPVLWEDPSAIDGWEVVQGAGYAGVIAPADVVMANLRGLFNLEIQGSWTPSAEQIATLEAGLPAFLKSAPRAEPDLHERVGDYHRQYFGYVLDGRALILVNAFCSEPEDWQSGMVFVMDGGDCYFMVSFDVTTGEFLDLRINGEA